MLAAVVCQVEALEHLDYVGLQSHLLLFPALSMYPLHFHHFLRFEALLKCPSVDWILEHMIIAKAHWHSVKKFCRTSRTFLCCQNLSLSCFSSGLCIGQSLMQVKWDQHIITATTWCLSIFLMYVHILQSESWWVWLLGLQPTSLRRSLNVHKGVWNSNCMHAAGDCGKCWELVWEERFQQQPSSQSLFTSSTLNKPC